MVKTTSTILISFFTIAAASFAFGEGRIEFSGKAKYNEQPVKNATVVLYALGATKEKIDSVTTKYDGKFEFSMSFDKMYRIEWHKEGYTEMVILVNGFVPTSEKGWIMSYSISFDIFKHKEGHETKMANDPIIQVSYSFKEKNFSQVKPYSNSTTYIRLEDNVKPSGTEENKTDNKEENLAAVEEAPITKEEEQFIKEREVKLKQSELTKEIAESVASEQEEEEIAIKQQEKALENKRSAELKTSRLREAIEKEKELARKEVVKNTAARSSFQESLMMEIADMMKEDKQKKP